MRTYWKNQYRDGKGPVAVAGPSGGVGAPGVPASPVVPADSRQDIQARIERRVITTALLVFVVWLYVALGQAHCASVAKPAAIYLSLSAADLASTEFAIRNGASEGNSFMDSHGIAKQAVIAGAFVGADVWLQRKGKPGHARALRVTYAALRIAAVAVNVRNATR